MKFFAKKEPDQLIRKVLNERSEITTDWAGEYSSPNLDLP